MCDWRAALRWTRTTLRSRSGIFWMLWIVPAFVFLWLVDSTEPGHALVFSVALVALGVGLIVATARTVARLILSGTLLIGAQVAVFLFASPQFDRPLAWTANSMLLNVTAPGLRQQQGSLADALADHPKSVRSTRNGGPDRDRPGSVSVHDVLPA